MASFFPSFQGSPNESPCPTPARGGPSLLLPEFLAPGVIFCCHGNKVWSKKPTTGNSTGNPRFWWEFGQLPVELISCSWFPKVWSRPVSGGEIRDFNYFGFCPSRAGRAFAQPGRSGFHARREPVQGGSGGPNGIFGVRL